MQSRRHFFGALAAPAAALAFDPARAADALRALGNAAGDSRPAAEVARDDGFWAEIARAFTVDRSIVNLNNGGVSPAPRFAQEAMKRHLDFSNQAPAYTMWRVLEPQREAVRQRLARQFGCDPEEIALTRNASEGLQILQLGFDLARGDVVLTTEQDYPRMITTFEQRARRDGIALHKIPLPTPCDDLREIAARFAEAIDEHRPKLVLLCHMISPSGQVLPVKEIVQHARSRGIPAIVDGAHSFAHIAFTRDDLDCDYYATSLHKWLSAPHGTGMLYVRKDKIRGLWPMMAAPEKLDDDIRKFEEIGTHPAANTLAVAEALTFHQGIGAERKQERLVHLRESWQRRLVDRYPDKVVLHTPRAPGTAYAIATVEIAGVEPGALHQWLFAEHRIYTTPIEHASYRGVRISPSVYTTPEEIDRFCAAVDHVVHHGLPA